MDKEAEFRNISGLEEMVTQIQDLFAIELILLTGYRVQETTVASIFNGTMYKRHQKSWYDLVLVTSATENASEHVVQDRVENKCRRFGSVNCIVLPAPKFNRFITEGHPFVCRLARHAVTLYDRGELQLAPLALLSGDQVGLYDRHCLELATQFMDLALLLQEQCQHPLSILHLHQAAEFILTGLFYHKTGYRVQTHNIDKLCRYTQNLMAGQKFDPSAWITNDRPAFALLQRGYLDTRYNVDFTIDPNMAIRTYLLVQQLYVQITGILDHDA